MTRTVAREIAVHLSFEAGVNDVSAQELLDTVFDPEYYETLAQEDELYSEYPDEKQMEYIRTVTAGVCEHLPELDSYIEKYAKNWRVGRISREEYENLRKKAETREVVKRRYFYPLDDGHTAEIDIYAGGLEGFKIVEVEFDSIEEAESFAPPDFFGKDVSRIDEYKNVKLALYGLPKDEQ